MGAVRGTRILLLTVLAGMAVGAGGWGDARADAKWALVFLGDRVWTGDVRAIGLGSDMQLVEDSLSLQYNPATVAAIRKFTFAAKLLDLRARRIYRFDTHVIEKLRQSQRIFAANFGIAFADYQRITLTKNLGTRKGLDDNLRADSGGIPHADSKQGQVGHAISF